MDISCDQAVIELKSARKPRGLAPSRVKWDIFICSSLNSIKKRLLNDIDYLKRLKVYIIKDDY